MGKKTIKQLCEERGLDEETAYYIVCTIKRLLEAAEKNQLEEKWKEIFNE